VHGCFWHCHGCAESHVPKSNRSYWQSKLGRNIERDALHVRELKRQGWRSLILWECQLRDVVRLENSLRRFLGSPGRMKSIER
jgi:DNA mismatch endonuclease (patch repair protein)